MNDAKIPQAELNELLKIKKAHANYVTATKRMAKQQPVMFQRRALGDKHAAGYLAAIKDFSQFVMDAGAEE